MRSVSLCCLVAVVLVAAIPALASEGGNDGKPPGARRDVPARAPSTPTEVPVPDEDLNRPGSAPSSAAAVRAAPPDFDEHGAPVRGLRLSLAAGEGAYRYGSGLELHLRLENGNAFAVSEPGLPAAGPEGGIHTSLRHVESLRFRFDFTDGESLVVSNDFGEAKVRHGRSALRLEAQQDLTASFELDGLAASSGALFDRLRSANAVSITAELPDGLISNGVTLAIERW